MRTTVAIATLLVGWICATGTARAAAFLGKDFSVDCSGFKVSFTVAPDPGYVGNVLYRVALRNAAGTEFIERALPLQADPSGNPVVVGETVAFAAPLQGPYQVLGGALLDGTDVFISLDAGQDILLDCPVSPPPGGEGCSHGYWKQSKHFTAWVGASPSDDFRTVFGVPASFNKTLLGALKLKGGKEKALAREAVAALLNASNPSVNYGFSVEEVKAIVQGAYVTKDWNGAKNRLEAENTAGCPLH